MSKVYPVYTREGLIFYPPDPSIGRVGSMVKACAYGARGLGFESHLGHFRADHFRNVQHHKDLHLLQFTSLAEDCDDGYIR